MRQIKKLIADKMQSNGTPVSFIINDNISYVADNDIDLASSICLPSRQFEFN
jgi:hypothetical protein